MEEPPLSHSQLGVKYYEKMMESKRHMGRPEFFNAAAHVLACPGRSSDHVYMFLHIEESRILEARWQCHMCDPWMQITADIACTLIEDGDTSLILGLELSDFENLLGGSDFVIASHTGAATLVAYKAGLDYEVKEALRNDQSGKVSPKSQLSELAYTGRDGLLRIKRLIENRFRDEELKIPRSRLESVCANGSVQDFSSLIQDLLERRAVETVRARGMGFPRSFDETYDEADQGS